MLFEISWLSRLEPQDVRKHILLKGTYQLEAKLREGKGALMLLAHADNWGLLPTLVLLTNVPVNVLYRPLDFAPLDRFLWHMRSRFSATMIRSRRSARQVIRALNRGELVAILMDQKCGLLRRCFCGLFWMQGGHQQGSRPAGLKNLRTGASHVHDSRE
jgi:KDO2-lipid IV(A) lauroyltransferase